VRCRRCCPSTFISTASASWCAPGRGSQLDAALQNAVVAFEVDEFDPIHHSGWSVAVTGVATEVGDPTELDAARQEPVTRWTPPGSESVVAISTELVSGRRVTTGTQAVRR
jgi:hypothetical protein